jgi:hypothetical protein
MFGGLEAIAKAMPLVSLAGTLICCACPIAAEHLSASPAGQPHEVLLLATIGQPAVSKGVTKPVGVQVRNACLGGASFEHLTDS